jgi:hypothetical protein
MIRRRDRHHGIEGVRAQHLVCSHLTRACRQAIAEIALEEGDDPTVRRRAVQLLKEILADWSDAQRWLRADIARRRRASTLTPR